MTDAPDDQDQDEDVALADDADAPAQASEGPPQVDRAAHAESGASEFSRRSGGALTSELVPEQFAERDRSLDSEHGQNPDELGLAFLTRATQDEPLGDQPESEQPSRDVDRPSTGERYTREQVPGAEITRERLITQLPQHEHPAHPHARINEPDKEVIMTVAKVTEITAESSESFDDAIREGIEAAGRTIENIRNVWIKDQQIIIHNNKPERYRVDLKVTFVLNDR